MSLFEKKVYTFKVKEFSDLNLAKKYFKELQEKENERLISFKDLEYS